VFDEMIEQRVEKRGHVFISADSQKDFHDTDCLKRSFINFFLAALPLAAPAAHALSPRFKQDHGPHEETQPPSHPSIFLSP
jgi:hypothetical protein